MSRKKQNLCWNEAAEWRILTRRSSRPRSRLLKTRVEIQHFPLEGYSQELPCTQSLAFHLRILKNRQIPNSCISMCCSKKIETMLEICVQNSSWSHLFSLSYSLMNSAENASLNLQKSIDNFRIADHDHTSIISLSYIILL
jgi:hypothetical protein